MNSFKPDIQKHNLGYLKSILIRKDNGDGKNIIKETKKRVTFKQCVEYLPDYQDMEVDQLEEAGEPSNHGGK